jgi:hypothetical protein
MIILTTIGVLIVMVAAPYLARYILLRLIKTKFDHLDFVDTMMVGCLFWVFITLVITLVYGAYQVALIIQS